MSLIEEFTPEEQSKLIDALSVIALTAYNVENLPANGTYALVVKKDENGDKDYGWFDLRGLMREVMSLKKQVEQLAGA